MSIAHNDFLESAKRLSASDQEVDWRNSVSRAYYAAYHHAMKSVDLCPPNAHLSMGSHERLSARYTSHAAKGAKAIAMVLQTMKRYRHAADYELNDSLDREVAANQIAQCESLHDRLVAFENTHRIKSA